MGRRSKSTRDSFSNEEEEEYVESESDAEQEPVRKSGRRPKPIRRSSDEEEGEGEGGVQNGSAIPPAQEDASDDSWIKDAKKVLKKIFDHQDNDNIFNEPVRSNVQAS